MQFRYRKKKRTDSGTVILHWLLAVSLALSVLTGLRFAVDMPETGYLSVVAPYLPVAKIWIIHILAGVVLIGVAVAYLLYLRNAGLFRRIALDRTRLTALKCPGSARWSAVNVLLYWLFFVSLIIQIVTGVILHRGYGGAIVTLHLWATWAILFYAVSHVAAHLAMGGLAQALRIVRPSQIPVAANPDSASLGGVAVFVLSALIGGAVAGAYLYADRASRDVLYVGRIDRTAASDLGPDLWAPAWRDAPVLHIHTNQGVNLDGPGAFHPGTHPLPDKPASASGRGMHYTEDGSAVNVWLWRAGGSIPVAVKTTASVPPPVRPPPNFAEPRCV